MLHPITDIFTLLNCH